ncbi:MAG: hypothetical protein AAF959_05055 [Cyanobacteria bacterium P01_D01_bin.56]
MSDAKVITPKGRQIGFYGFLAAAIVSAGFSLKHALNPAPVYSPGLQQNITEALRQGQGFQAPLDTSRPKGYSLLLGGVAVVCGLGAVSLSAARPTTLTTATLDKVADPHRSESVDTISDEVFEDQGQIVLDQLTQLFIEFPWLEEVVDIEGSLMDLLIIIGEPGKGKSSLASSIGILRQLVHRTPIYQFDADADKNVRDRIWVAGEVVGMTHTTHDDAAGDWGHLSYKEQHLRAKAVMVEKLNDGEEPAITAIYDELIRLSSNGFTADEIEAHYKEYTAYRKRGDKVIWLWHGDTRATSGLDKLPKESPLLNALLDYAAVINFNLAPEGPDEAKRRRRSKQKNSDRAMFKPAGQAYARENMELIVIPKLMYPSTLLDLIGSAAEYFDIRMTGHRDPGLAQRRRQIRKKINGSLRGINPDGQGNFRSSLEALFQSQIAQYQLNNPHDIELGEIKDGFDLEGLPSRSLFVALLAYLEDPSREQLRNDQGYFSIRKIQANWGKKKSAGSQRFRTTDALRAFLAVYSNAGMGEWGDDNLHWWKPLVDTDDFEDFEDK